MNTQVSNRRVLSSFLLLGLVLLPALGLLPLVLGPKNLPAGKGPGLATKIGWPTLFLGAGAAVTVYAACRCPSGFSFTDVLTVQYLFGQRVLRREDVVGLTTQERSGKVGGPGEIPLSFSDSVVVLQLADGTKLAWGVPNGIRGRLETLVGMWLAREVNEEPVS